MSRIRGLELLFNLVKDQIKSKQDCVVAALHCLLINEGLQCVGTGEEFSDEDARSTTELLPEQWNKNQEVYTLRYISKAATNRYLIKVVKAGGIMHINIVLNEDKTAAMSANIDKLISDDFRNYSSAYNELDSLKDAFQKDVVEKLMKKPSVASTSKSTDNKSSPLRVGPSSVRRPQMPIPPDFGNDSPFSGGQPAFPEVGGRDLDPLGRGSGGMLLDPSNFGVPRGINMPPYGPRPGLPRGSVPPGARFDPFGPPLRGPNRFEPNPDHFRPPDFDDFM
ncbi:proteasome inhibitor PI31 subunit-like [Argiope bruennichi]|uniref:Proteasome inhibitor PI31 subunit n=1 Tax=Argiope bruennichi TaxID=94029 RepID=A0A8T0F012_ARGBR|nr:proteasome inhibitor PI31 subunit-like [Argiope bruennichi]KAF8783321.1 Proteasome inhibitor PI31 subunit like protein [Argiope bruennichi]